MKKIRISLFKNTAMNDFVVEQYFVPTDIFSYLLGIMTGMGLGAILVLIICGDRSSYKLDSKDVLTINNTSDYWLQFDSKNKNKIKKHIDNLVKLILVYISLIL